jgi:hypothetical protein
MIMGALLFCRLRVGLSEIGCSGSRDVLAGRTVLERDEAAGQDVGSDKLQVDIVEAVEDPLPPRFPEDLWEHDEPEPGEQLRLQEGFDHRDAADGAQRIAALGL